MACLSSLVLLFPRFTSSLLSEGALNLMKGNITLLLFSWDNATVNRFQSIPDQILNTFKDVS